MVSQFTKKRKALFTHITFWVLYVALNYFINFVQSNGQGIYVIDSIGKYACAALIFYSTAFFVLPYYFARRRIVILCLLILFIAFGSYLLKSFFYYKIFIHFDYPTPPYSQSEFFFMNIWWWSQYTLFAFGYWFAIEAIKKQKELRLTEQKQLRSEQEKLQLENTALRAQINPHFLYNTLDFLYAKALPVSDELSDSVMKLSDIMRYSLKPQDAEGLVYLADEAEHIQNIIEMNQLRFDNKLNVDFTTSNIPDDVKIMPLLLITMVENVFKHGVTSSPDLPARIALSVNEQRQLHFSTNNKKRKGPKEHSTGIGLNNTLKRLKNTYGARCNVAVEDKPDEFKVEINIQLMRNENNYVA